MINSAKIKYIDYLGKELPDHDGKLIFISEEIGVQFFGLDGRGFIHDGSPIDLPNGTKQFFLHDGTAIIHDGSPIKLPNGLTQYFNEEGGAMWPVDTERMTSIHNEQRSAFFKEMIKRINKETPLSDAETEDLRLAFLAAEHPDSEDSGHIMWSEDIHATGLKPVSDDTSRALMVFEVIWPRVWRKYQLRHKEKLAARYVLNRQKQSKCPLASKCSAESMLINEINLEFKKAEKEISLPKTSLELFNYQSNIKTTSNGIFELDDQLQQYVKKMKKGEGSNGFLTAFRETYKAKNFSFVSREKLWREPLFMHRCLAEIAWFNTVREKVESSYKKPPALTLFSLGMVSAPFKAKSLRAIDKKIIDQNNNEIGLIKTPSVNELTAIDASTISKIISKKNIDLLQSINFHRLFRWEIKEVTNRYLSGVADFRKIAIDGAFKELANLIGAGAHKQTVQDIREIIAWQQQAFFDRGDGTKGHMLTYDLRPNPKDRRKNMLSLYLTDMLLPNFVFSMPNKNQSQRELRMLIPLLDIPPLVTNNNRLHAAQAAFQVELCIEMRKRAKEIVEKGGIHLPNEQKISLAETVGLDLETLPKVFDRWTQDGKDAPKMLEEIEKDVYNLSEHHLAARDFIISAGKMEQSASAAGKKSRTRKK
jgi:hypothetical protein